MAIYKKLREVPVHANGLELRHGRSLGLFNPLATGVKLPKPTPNK